MTDRSMSAREPLVSVANLGKSYRRGPEEVRALVDATFSLFRGEVVLLVGPSGSGKSTLLNLLCGWEEPASGEVRWRGHAGDLVGLAWDRLAVVPQALGLLEDLSVRENVNLPIRLGRSDSKAHDRAEALLRVFGLAQLAERATWEVSLGEQQRAAVARALVLAPEVVLADEPTGHQDQGWAGRVLRVMRLAAEQGMACLIASHNQDVIRAADRVLTIRDGHVRSGTGVPSQAPISGPAAGDR